MTLRNYYRIALLLPVAIPAALSPLMLLDGGPLLLRGLLVYLYGSLLIGGIPYVLFALGFLLWMRGKPDAQVRRAVLVSPLVYTAVLVAGYFAFLWLDGTLGNGEDAAAALIGFGVAFGYAYVAIAELGRLILRPGETSLQVA